LYNIKKSHQFIFSLQYEKKNLNKRKEKKIKEKKNQIGNILKGKKNKGKEINC
jgi:hypothetical protein